MTYELSLFVTPYYKRDMRLKSCSNRFRLQTWIANIDIPTIEFTNTYRKIGSMLHHLRAKEES